MKPKKVVLTSEFPASTNRIWEKLQRLETLQFIARPYAKFKALGEAEAIWEEGRSSKFKLAIFGFLPMGVHTISVIQFDKSALSIYTNEGNKIVPVWNHKIFLKRISDNQTLYTDEVEIHAGLITPFVYLWSKAFYKHRQKKWVRLLHIKG